MKNIFFVSLIMLSLGCTAQFTNTSPTTGSYTTNPHLDKFVGTWIAIGNSGQDTMMVVLQKQKIHFPSPFNFDADMIVGWHSYKNTLGILVESDIVHVGNNYWNASSSLLGSTDLETPNKLDFTSFTDIVKHKTGEVSFILITGSLTQAQWKLTEVRGLRSGTRGFTVPINLIFNKQ